MTDRWTHIREIFREALDLEPARWDAFLQERCPDEATRERVAQMLREYGAEDSFLASPVAGLGQRMFGSPHDMVGKRIGSYEIVRAIAQGGMGMVFEAMDVRLKKKVALKMMNPGLMQDPTFRSRFEQEAQMLAQLEDPHFVRVHALIEEAGNAFIVMEYVDGVTLAQHIRSKGRLPAREVVGMGVQLLQALSKAHRQGVIHRDLKPSNIMLTRTGEGRPLVKVLDFGIAKSIQADASQTRTQGAVGTLFYMSPEQARGLKSIDHRTDLYSLGVTLYEALCGDLPFDAREDEYGIRRDIVEGRIVPLAQRTTDAPPGVTDVIMKSISASPEERFRTSEEMQHALRLAFAESEKRMPADRPVAAKRSGKAWMTAAAVGLLGVAAVAYIAFTRPAEPPPPEFAAAQPAIDTSRVDPTASEGTPVAEDTTLISIPPAGEADTEDGDPVQTIPPPDPVGRPAPGETSEPIAIDDPVEEQAADSTEFQVPPLDTSSVIQPQAQELAAMTNVQFRIVPFGDVYVDGQLKAKNQGLYSLDVPAGRHMFRFDNEDAVWMCALAFDETPREDRTVYFTGTVDVTLTAADADTGALLNAEILVDGMGTPNTTPQKVRLSPGVHTIEMRLEGYEFVELLPESPTGCFQQIDANRLNLDATVYDGNVRARARMRPLN